MVVRVGETDQTLRVEGLDSICETFYLPSKAVNRWARARGIRCVVRLSRYSVARATQSVVVQTHLSIVDWLSLNVTIDTLGKTLGLDDNQLDNSF